MCVSVCASVRPSSSRPFHPSISLLGFTLLQFLFFCHFFFLMHHWSLRYCRDLFSSSFLLFTILSLFPNLCAPTVLSVLSLLLFFVLISCFWFCYAWISFAFTPTFKHWASLTVSVGHYPHISLWKRSFQTCPSFISDSDSSCKTLLHLEAVLFLYLSACCWIRGVQLQIPKIFLAKENNPRGEKNEAGNVLMFNNCKLK